jgi:hypothetical protein
MVKTHQGVSEMKRVVTLILAALAVGTLSACTGDSTVTFDPLSSENAIASLSYLSAGFLHSQEADPTVSAYQFLAETDETELEGELDDVNVYLDKLRAFIENGPEGFGSIATEASDRAEYEFKMTITVQEDVYVLYYNIDATTMAIDGLFVIEGVEYAIEGVNRLEDSTEFADDDDDDDMDEDDEDEEEEFEQEMTLIARNGEDVITITYEAERDASENTVEFRIEQVIGGVESEIEIEISEEADEYSIEIYDNGNYYEFSRELEDGETVYELEYEVDGVEGEVTIYVSVNELGETVYTYEIEEEGREARSIDRKDPDEDDDEDEEDEELDSDL